MKFWYTFYGPLKNTIKQAHVQVYMYLTPFAVSNNNIERSLSCHITVHDMYVCTYVRTYVYHCLLLLSRQPYKQSLALNQ